MSYDTYASVLTGMLYNALEDALDGMEEMITYVPEYYAKKYDLLAYIERAKTSMSVAEEVFAS